MTEKTTKKRTVQEKKADEDVIYVGSKPLMSYVLAVISQFYNNGSNEVIIKARGRAISTAVDTAEIVRNKFIANAKIRDIKIATESLPNQDGKTSNVSAIEIYLTTKKKAK